MLARFDLIQDKLFKIRNGTIKQGLKLDIPEIDEHIRYKQGNFNLLIGHANVGKSTIICYFLVLWALKHKLKFLIWSSENTADSIIRKLIEFKMQISIQQANEKQISTALKWCDRYFKIIDINELYTYKDLINEAKDIYNEWPYEGLLIDPYNSLAKDHQLMKGVGGHEYDYQVASEFRLFAKKHNITIFLNAHGVTEAMRRTYPKGHQYENLPQPLGMASVEGGGKWGNRADDVWSIHRFTSHPNEWMFTHIHVLKIKETETGGRCTSFEAPIRLKMSLNNVGYEFMGIDLLNKKLTNKTIEF